MMCGWENPSPTPISGAMDLWGREVGSPAKFVEVRQLCQSSKTSPSFSTFGRSNELQRKEKNNTHATIRSDPVASEEENHGRCSSTIKQPGNQQTCKARNDYSQTHQVSHQACCENENAILGRGWQFNVRMPFSKKLSQRGEAEDPKENLHPVCVFKLKKWYGRC